MTKWRAPILLGAVGIAALGWMGWQFGLSELTDTLRRVSLPSVLLYLMLGAAAVTSHSLRWQLIMRALGKHVPFARLVYARLAGDAVGALVPSGKLAGEPVRVALVRAEGIAGAEAGAGVSIDRLLEVISNMLCFMLYVSIFSLSRMGSAQIESVAVAVMLALLVALSVPLILLRRGISPFSLLYSDLAQRWLRPLAPWLGTLRTIELHLQRFFREHAAAFVIGLAGALATEALVVCQYWVLLAAFGLRLDLPTLLLALVGTGFARSVPAPAGLGALEASQVSVLALAQGRPDVGFVVGIVMRLHETLWIAIGLAALAARGKWSTAGAADVAGKVAA
ncbi:MAG TPA: lysylphosphatidylglycerol synthase transmembrane domain-containing protein [Candidatus Binatia bacterium]|nr:lysylphosphatidylglycerol synthase transmembrane domain-containing protein [Candidatus Binatia bacterium]